MTTKQKKAIICVDNNKLTIPKKKAKVMAAATKSSSQQQQQPQPPSHPHPPSVILPATMQTTINPPPPPPAILIDNKGPIAIINNTISTTTSMNAESKGPDPGGSQQQLHQQPIDLVAATTTQGPPGSTHIISGIRTGSSPSVLQLHPIGTFRTTSSLGNAPASSIQGVKGGSNSIVTASANSSVTSNIYTTNSTQPTSIISVNRSGSNLTILPARVPLQTSGSNGSTATLQFARGTTILRPAGTISTSVQPGSITVTPISGSSIRLAGATMSNGSWLQTNNNPQGATFTPIRPLQVTNRAIRPETKVIHIPQQGTVQHLTQLQVVDGKGATILKPQQLSGAQILRTIQTSNANVTGAPIPITPSFTIRSAGISNTRPLTSSTTVQKVITQPAHGPPIQLISGSKLPQHTIQTITPIPRLTLASPVCLTISTTATLNTNSSTPIVAVASKGGNNATNLIVNPTLGSGNAIPLTKIYDVNPLLNIIAKSQSQGTLSSTGNVTISMGGTNSTLQSQLTNAQSIVSTTNSAMQSNQIVHVHAPISVSASSSTIGLSQNSTYIGSKNTGSLKPITIDKRHDLKITPSSKNNVVSGPVILTSHTQGNSLANHSSGSIAIPIGPQTYAHPITIANPSVGSIQHQIITVPSGGNQPGTILPASSTGAGTLSSNTFNIIGGQQQSLTLGGHIIATSNIQPNTSQVIPASIVTSHSVGSITTTSVTTIPSTTSVIVTTSSILNCSSSAAPLSAMSAVSSSSSGISSISQSTPSIVVSNLPSSSNIGLPPGQSSNQSSTSAKSTLSPRPSILRKRDAASSDNIQLRAQRNLALNFVTSSGNTIGAITAGSGPSISNPLSITVTSAANKENNSSSILPGGSISNINFSGGLNLLKKDFQPPNEETSWHSCSSNSSSGSTTISTTSETAEIQLQQQSLGVPIANLTTNVSTNSIYNVSNGIITNSSAAILGHQSFDTSTNGSFRTTSLPPNTPSGRSRLTSTSKAANKDLDRVKGVKGKDDHVSPRKKPRKQQLTTSDLLEPSSSEISFYQGKRLKKNELLDPSLFQGFSDKFGPELGKEDEPAQRFSYIIKKPHFLLIESDKLVTKARLNHFQKYSDVKAKDERKPTLIEMANQKDIMQKVEGYKLQHLNKHIEDVIQTEKIVVSDFTSMLERAEIKSRQNNPSRDLNKILELLKGNIQRCKVITDQMSEAKCQVSRILEHKSSVGQLLGKYVNKRPIKKRERL